MTLAIYGEITADRERIILLAEGADEEVGYASQSLQLLTPLIKPTDPPGALHLPASWPAVVQLSTTYGQAWKPGPALTAWITEQVMARGSADNELTVKTPPGLEARPYQVAGARMIGLVGSALLFDDPGTGKTWTTILGLVERAAGGHDVLPIIVVCPNAVQDSWVEHFRQLAPRWRVTAWRGSPEQRVRKAGTADVYVASYGTARRDAKDSNTRGNHNPLLGLGAKTVVADEVHKIADQGSGQSRAVRRLAARARQFVGLSGTPIRRNTDDIWPTLYAMDAKAYPSKERWARRYCQTVQGDYSVRVLGLDPRAEEEFRTTLLGQYRRVSKADVLKELPPKVYSVRTVDIPEGYRKAYDQMEQDMLAELPDGGELSAMGVLAQMTRLLQLASAAADVEVTHETVDVNGLLEDRIHTHVRLKEPSWKVDVLLEVLAERPGQQVIACAPSKQLMQLAGAIAQREGYRVGYVVGAQSAKERTRQIEAFQAGELDLICVTTQAGGVGITLTAASTVVFLQRPWSLIDSSQMEDRCFGAGTPVLTVNGWRPIEELGVGDAVITHTGAVQPVLDAWSQQAKQMMAEVSITGQETVTCTGDHRFMLRDGTWREAADLRPGDWLAMPGNNEVEDWFTLPFKAHRVPEVFVNQWGNEQVNTRLKRADDLITLTDDFLFTVGYFAGDGFASISDDKGRFISFSGNPGAKIEALDRCEKWAHSVGLDGSRKTRGSNVEQRFYSTDWAHWFFEHFGGRTGAVNKQLPGWAKALNPRQSQVILDGLAASDGYRRGGKPRVEYVTVSPVLAADVAQLATRAGHRPAHTIGSTGQHIIAFGGTEGPRSAGRVRSVLLRHPAKPGGVRERIYDLTILDDETFVVGGVVVHNCHRIGSERHSSIEIIDVVATKTLETRIRSVLKDKAGQLSKLVEDPRIVAELLGGASVRELSKRSKEAVSA